MHYIIEKLIITLRSPNHIISIILGMMRELIAVFGGKFKVISIIYTFKIYIYIYILFECPLHAIPEVIFQAKLGRVHHLIEQSLVDDVTELLPLPR